MASISHIKKNISEKSQLSALLCCLFFGIIALHRFYVGKVLTAVLFMLTFGGFGIWWLIDLILIVTDNFTDKAGNKLKNW